MDPESIELFLAYCIKIYLGVWISKLHFCLPSTPCMFYCSVDSSFTWIANCPCTPVSIGRQCLSNCIFEGRIVFISRHLKKWKIKTLLFTGGMRNVVVHYATNPPEIGRRMSTRSEEIAFIDSNIWRIAFLSKKIIKSLCYLEVPNLLPAQGLLNKKSLLLFWLNHLYYKSRIN